MAVANKTQVKSMSGGFQKEGAKAALAILEKHLDKDTKHGAAAAFDKVFNSASYAKLKKLARPGRKAKDK